MYELFQSCLQSPDLHLDLYGLVGAHDWVCLCLPPVNQRATLRLLTLEGPEVLARLVVVRGHIVGEDIDVVHEQVGQDLRWEVQALRAKISCK